MPDSALRWTLAEQMVQQQIASRGITDAIVLRAMSVVPRHEFLLVRNIGQSYSDVPVPIGFGQTISQPYIVALMTSLLNLHGSERVLEIGSGSGYQTAILSQIVKMVYSIERIPRLLERSREVLSKLGLHNASIRLGDNMVEWNEKAPFDRIIVAAASAEIPPVLIEQLADEGVLVMPVGGKHLQRLAVVRRSGNEFNIKYSSYCRFVPIVQHNI